jgi:threonyl-tRNA synthetase
MLVTEKPREPIKITLPDGREIEGKSWETTPYSIAANISKQMADRMVISEV